MYFQEEFDSESYKIVSAHTSFSTFKRVFFGITFIIVLVGIAELLWFMEFMDVNSSITQNGDYLCNKIISLISVSGFLNTIGGSVVLWHISSTANIMSNVKTVKIISVLLYSLINVIPGILSMIIYFYMENTCLSYIMSSLATYILWIFLFEHIIMMAIIIGAMSLYIAMRYYDKKMADTIVIDSDQSV
jgi:hypothetical protein